MNAYDRIDVEFDSIFVNVAKREKGRGAANIIVSATSPHVSAIWAGPVSCADLQERVERLHAEGMVSGVKAQLRFVSECHINRDFCLMVYCQNCNTPRRILRNSRLYWPVLRRIASAIHSRLLNTRRPSQGNYCYIYTVNILLHYVLSFWHKLFGDFITTRFLQNIFYYFTQFMFDIIF